MDPRKVYMRFVADSMPKEMLNVPCAGDDVERTPWRVSKGGRWGWRREEVATIEVMSQGRM